MGRRGGRALLAPLFFLAACGGPSTQARKEINRLIAEQKYEDARVKIEGAKMKEYGPKNAVLYNLDMGVVLHHAGRYKESDQFLDRAENRMKELYTKSVSKAAGTLILNDNTVDYAGQPYERALTNVLRALNYVFLGQPDEALVESRKVEQYLEELRANAGKGTAYKDDAFARYLDSLLYADGEKADDARISLEAAQKAYGQYAKAYAMAAPPLDAPDLPRDKGEIVFIHYNGLAPRKVTKTHQIAWGRALATVNSAKEEGDASASDPRVANAIRAGIADKSITVAFPEYVQDPFMVNGSEIEVGEARAQTKLFENVSAIAMKDLQDRMPGITARAIARATIKFILAKAATDEAEKKYGKGTWQATLASVAANVTAAATEIADTRSWTTLPSQIRLARLRVPPGQHEVTIRFLDSSGAVVSTQIFKDIAVKKGRRTYLHHRTSL
jgi:uncharacterized protein